jgi:hypothetical protein
VATGQHVGVDGTESLGHFGIVQSILLNERLTRKKVIKLLLFAEEFVGLQLGVIGHMPTEILAAGKIQLAFATIEELMEKMQIKNRNI